MFFIPQQVRRPAQCPCAFDFLRHGMDRCEVPAPLFQPGIDFTGTNLAQQPLGERMDFLVAARPQAAVLARIGVDKTLVSIEQEDPVMSLEEHTSELQSLMRNAYAVLRL